MNIQGLNHFTIRTHRVRETTDFFANVIGLTVGPRPAFRFPGEWMYAGEFPILHIVSRTGNNLHMEAYLGQRNQLEGSGCVDHISLQGKNLAAMQDHLIQLDLPFRERIIPEILEHQLFVEDPNGVTIEMIFPYSPTDRVMGEPMPRLEIDSK